MASTYTLNQGIEKPATGEQSGTWGATTNTNFDIIDRSLSGVGALSLTGTTTTLTTTDGSLTDGMYKVLVLGGSPSGTNTITLSDNTQDKFYFVVNASGEEVQFSQGTGANATISDGFADIIYADGAGGGAAVASLFATSLKLGNDLSLKSDSAVLGFGADLDTTLTHTDGTGLTLNSTNKLAFGDDATFINQSTNGQLDVDADVELELTAPTVDIAASTALTIATPSLIISDNTASEPIVQIKNTHDGTTAGELRFVMDKGSAGADGDDLGTISFYGDDSGQNQTAFAQILAEVSESANTDEAGKLSLFVAESDGTNTALTAGLVLEGEHATDGEVDVTIGAGTSSTTTVAGDLVIGASSAHKFGTEVAFNENGADINFRVESGGDANLFKVDAGDNKIYIGHGADQAYDAGLTPVVQIAQVGNTVYGGLGMAHYSNDSEGSVLVMGSCRATSVTGTTIVADNDVLGRIDFQGMDGSDFETGARIVGSVDGTPGSDDMPGRLTFWTTADGAHSATERMRIASTGRTTLNATLNNYSTLLVNNAQASEYPAGIRISYTAMAPDDGNQYALIFNDTGASRFLVKNDGDVQNHDNSYGATSDERIKQNIVDSNSQWDDIKAIKVRNFKRKDDVAQYGDKAWSQIGVVAQEVEAVCPKIIREENPSPEDIKMSAEFGTLVDDTEKPDTYYEDGDDIPDGKKIGDAKTYKKKVGEVKSKVKSIGYSVLYMKAVKALQEAMARIETLEAKVTALEDA